MREQWASLLASTHVGCLPRMILAFKQLWGMYISLPNPHKNFLGSKPMLTGLTGTHHVREQNEDKQRVRQCNIVSGKGCRCGIVAVASGIVPLHALAPHRCVL